MNKLIILTLVFTAFGALGATSSTNTKKVTKVTKLKTTPIVKRSRSIASSMGIVIPFETQMATEAPKLQK